MDEAREKLTTASHKLAEAMYKAGSPQAAPGAGPSGSGTGCRREPNEERTKA